MKMKRMNRPWQILVLTAKHILMHGIWSGPCHGHMHVARGCKLWYVAGENDFTWAVQCGYYSPSFTHTHNEPTECTFGMCRSWFSRMTYNVQFHLYFSSCNYNIYEFISVILFLCLRIRYLQNYRNAFSMFHPWVTRLNAKWQLFACKCHSHLIL